MNSPNRASLIRVARRLHSLPDEFVFVGGQVVELLITDSAAVRVRPTADVDVICRVAVRSKYQALGNRLRAVGFREDTSEGAPICRWVAGTDILDVMPTDARILGLKSAWFDQAVRSAEPYTLDPHLTIHIPSAPTFLATKWEALVDTEDDWRWSRHAEDIVKVVAGRPTLLDEVRHTDRAVSTYLTARACELLDSGYVDDVVSAALPDAQQVPNLTTRAISRIKAIAGRGGPNA